MTPIDKLGMGELPGLLRKWADVLTISSGDFVNEDLRRAADAITALIAERDGLATTRDAARANFLTMQGAAAKLLEDANDYKATMLANYERAISAEAQLKAAREALEKLACRHVTEQPLWWQLEARTALNPTVKDNG